MADRVYTSSVPVDGAKVRLRRQLRGLTVEGLAQAADISRSYVATIETGRKNLSPPTFVRLCNALELPANRRHTLLRDDATEEPKVATEAVA